MLAPRKRGIQYSRGSYDKFERHGVLGRPVKPGDDNGVRRTPRLVLLDLVPKPARYRGRGRGAVARGSAKISFSHCREIDLAEQRLQRLAQGGIGRAFRREQHDSVVRWNGVLG